MIKNLKVVIYKKIHNKYEKHIVKSIHNKHSSKIIKNFSIFNILHFKD